MKLFILLSIILAGIQASWGVPLLGETSGTIKEGLVTLYKDSENPNKVYFFPNSTAIVKDQRGLPLFNFVFWKNQSSAVDGAYLTLTTKLQNSPEMNLAINNYLSAHPQAEVAVLPIKSSTIGLQTTDPTKIPLSTIFKEFNFSKVGGVVESQIGVNAILTDTGARVLKSLLKKESGSQLIKFDYCYNVQGYGPNMNASIKINMKRVYEYFENSHSGGWGWFSWQIKSIIEKLHQDNHIAITMNGGDATKWEVLEKVANSIVSRLFSNPELQSNQVHIAGGNRLFTLGVGSVKKEELKEEVWNFIRRDLETREFCTAVSVNELYPFIDQIVTEAE